MGVDIRTYSIIYDLLNDVKEMLSGMMSPVISEEVTGQAEVRETFVVAKVGTIAGCKVMDGSIIRNSGARLIRDGITIYTTKISSSNDLTMMSKRLRRGFECGLCWIRYNDIQKRGDIIGRPFKNGGGKQAKIWKIMLQISSDCKAFGKRN